MIQCAYCKAETNLYFSGVPICIECSEAREVKRKPPAIEQDIRTVLLQALIKSTLHNSEATREFNEVMGQFPSGLPHPDGAQRIKNASSNLSTARKEMMKAHARLSDFIEHGAVPIDLKRSG